jgi:hypothetical protein
MNKFLIVIGVVVIAILVLMKTRKPSSYTKLMATSDNPNVRTLFISAISARLDAISNCIADEFRKKYDYSTAKALVNVDAFKNNPEVKKILDQCTFNIIQHIFSIVLKAASTECGKNNVKAVVLWIVSNVEFRIHSDAEIDEIVKLVDKMTCWTQNVISEYAKLTNEKVGPIIQSYITEVLRAPFLAHKRYTQWISSQLYYGSVYRFKELGRLPSEYPQFISSATPEEFDKHVQGDLSKLISQVRVAEYLYNNSWCKDVPQMLYAMNDIPFEIYSPEQVESIGKKILETWCWDPQTIVAQTRDVLNSVL